MEMLTELQIAERLHCSLPKVRELITSGYIPAIRPGLEYLTPEPAFDAAMVTWANNAATTRRDSPITAIDTQQEAGRKPRGRARATPPQI